MPILPVISKDKRYLSLCGQSLTLAADSGIDFKGTLRRPPLDRMYRIIVPHNFAQEHIMA